MTRINFKGLHGKIVDIRIIGMADESVYTSGYLLGESKSLLCIRRCSDLIFDGYEVFKKDRILSVKSTKANCFMAKILDTEGLNLQTESVQPIDISSEETFLNQILANHYPLAAYWLDEARESCLTLGFVRDSKTRKFSILPISSQGLLHRRVAWMRKEDVFGYMYGDRYSVLFGKYAKILGDGVTGIPDVSSGDTAV